MKYKKIGKYTNETNKIYVLKGPEIKKDTKRTDKRKKYNKDNLLSLFKIDEDYTFNDMQHIINFVRYMFILTKFQAEKHTCIKQIGMVNKRGYSIKSRDYFSAESVKKEYSKEIFREIRKCKVNENNSSAFMIKMEIRDERDAEKITPYICKVFKTIQKENNIEFLAVASHFYQVQNKDLHIHVLYKRFDNNKNSLQELFIQKMAED